MFNQDQQQATVQQTIAPIMPSQSPPPSMVVPPSSSGNKKVVLAILGLLVLAGGIGAGVLLVSTQQNMSKKAAEFSPINCPLTPKANRTIITFNGNFIVSNGTQEQSLLGPVTTNIPAGQYTITLVSYEKDHPATAMETQESWSLLLNNSAGTSFSQTNSIRDLPDGETIRQEVVDSSLLINQTIYSVTAKHTAYPTGSANSINPVCASFDLISAASPTAQPTPTASSSASPSATPKKTASPSPTSATSSALATIPPDLLVTGVEAPFVIGVGAALLLLIAAVAFAL